MMIILIIIIERVMIIILMIITMINTIKIISNKLQYCIFKFVICFVHAQMDFKTPKKLSN